MGKEPYYIAEAVLSHKHLAGGGPFTKSCEKWLEDTLTCKKALLTHSCTAALEMVAMLCRLGPGDEVIMPSFTFVSTANTNSHSDKRLSNRGNWSWSAVVPGHLRVPLNGRMTNPGGDREI